MKERKFRLESVWLPQKDVYAVAVDVLHWPLLLSLIEGLPRHGFTVYLPQAEPRTLDTVPLAYIIDDYMKDYVPVKNIAERITKWFEFYTNIVLISFYTPPKTAYTFADDVITVPFDFAELVKLLKRRQMREIALTRNLRYGYAYLLPEVGIILDPRIQDAIVEGNLVGLTTLEFDVLVAAILTKSYWTYKELGMKIGMSHKSVRKHFRRALEILPQLKPYFREIDKESGRYRIFVGVVEPIEFDAVDASLRW